MKKKFLSLLVLLICIGQIAICHLNAKGKGIMQIEKTTRTKSGPLRKPTGIVIREPGSEDQFHNHLTRTDLSRSQKSDQSTFEDQKSDQSTFERQDLNHLFDVDGNLALSITYSLDTLDPEDVDSLFAVLAETHKTGDPEPAHTLQNLDSVTQRTTEQPGKTNVAQGTDPLDAEPHSTSSQKAVSIPETESKEYPLQIQNQQQLDEADGIGGPPRQRDSLHSNLEKPGVIEAHKNQDSLQIQPLSDISAYTSAENSIKLSTARGQTSPSNPEKPLDRVRSARPRTKKTKSTRSKDDAFPHFLTNVPPPSDPEKNLSQGNVDPPHGQGGIYEYAPPYHQSHYRPAASAYEYANPIPVEMQQQQMSHSQIHLVFFIMALSVLLYISRLF